MIFCDNRVQQLFYHSITEFVFLMNILGKRSDLPFSRKSDRKKEPLKVRFPLRMCRILFAIKHKIKQLDGIAHEQTIICRQLFAGHVMGFRPMKRKKNLHRMIICFIIPSNPKIITSNKLIKHHGTSLVGSDFPGPSTWQEGERSVVGGRFLREAIDYFKYFDHHFNNFHTRGLIVTLFVKKSSFICRCTYWTIKHFLFLGVGGWGTKYLVSNLGFTSV